MGSMRHWMDQHYWIIPTKLAMLNSKGSGWIRLTRLNPLIREYLNKACCGRLFTHVVSTVALTHTCGICDEFSVSSAFLVWPVSVEEIRLTRTNPWKKTSPSCVWVCDSPNRSPPHMLYSFLHDQSCITRSREIHPGVHICAYTEGSQAPWLANASQPLRNSTQPHGHAFVNANMQVSMNART